MKQKEDRHYQVIISRELLRCVPLNFSLLSSYVKSLSIFFFLAYKKVDYKTNCFSLTPHVISTPKKNSVPL